MLAVLLIALIALALVRPVGAREPPRWVEAAWVVGCTAAFVARASSLPVQDQPLGTDWFSYLKNAIALGEGNYAEYQTWRGPLHAWVSLALIPVTGDLVGATQLLALVAQSACLPLTWWLGRRLVGPWPALLAVALLAGWPDLALFARFSTPYPLLACLFLTGAASTAAALTAGRDRAAAAYTFVAGVSFGLAVTTDLRAAPMAAAVLVGAVLAAAVERRPRHLLVAGGMGILCLVVAAAVLAQLPVAMTSLAEQIALQRDLNATAGGESCLPHGQALPTLAELFGACARATLIGNLTRAQRAAPVTLVVLAVLTVLGLRRPATPLPRWGPALLALPALPALPSLLLVGVQHRYFTPLAPLAALLLTHGWARLRAPRIVPRRPGWPLPPIATAATVLLVLAWNLLPSTLLRRPSGGNTGVAPAVALGDVRGPTAVRRVLREQLVPGDHVVDCARLGLRLRLYPTPVEEPRPPSQCARLYTNGPTSAGATWLLVPVTGPPAPTWQSAFTFSRGRESVALLRGER